jgi:hypothetical protein
VKKKNIPWRVFKHLAESSTGVEGNRPWHKAVTVWSRFWLSKNGQILAENNLGVKDVLDNMRKKVCLWHV